MTDVGSAPNLAPAVRALPAAAGKTVPASAVIAVAAYAAAQMLADVASVKIGSVGGYAVDMGTFIYPVTFSLRDLVHKTLGRANARVLIVTCGVANVLMAGYLWWVARVPSDAAWGLGEEFARVMTPVARIVWASIAAEVLAELADTEVYHWFVTRVTTGHQWARVLVSNAVSVPLDSLLFSVLAFGGVAGLEGLPWESVAEIFAFNVAVKGLMTLLSLPLIYVAPDPPEGARP